MIMRRVSLLGALNLRMNAGSSRGNWARKVQVCGFSLDDSSFLTLAFLPQKLVEERSFSLHVRTARRIR